MRTGPVFLACVLSLAVIGWAARVSAFPELALETGQARCSTCHFAPAGGGLINRRGRAASSDELSLGGNGEFLHGLFGEMPEWLALGGDLRAAGIYNDVGASAGPEWRAFPMEADLRARVAIDTVSLNVTGGIRGSTLRTTSAYVLSYFVSPDHYLMWKPAPRGFYARAGRFFAPQGLRLPDHTIYVRRYTGTNLYEEPYALGLGVVYDEFELHATGFLHDPIIDVGPNESGAVLYGEWHVARFAVGFTTRAGFGPETTRLMQGLVLRANVASVLSFLGEADFVVLGVQGVSARQNQFVAYAGLDVVPARSLHVSVWYERFDEALGVWQASRNALGGSLRWYPSAHFELILEGRWQFVGPLDQARLAMLQVHYYL